MKRLYIILLLAALSISNNVSGQYWTTVGPGLNDIQKNHPPFAICSDSNNIYVSYPISYHYDSIYWKNKCVVGVKKWNGVFWSNLPSVELFINHRNITPEIKSMIVYNGELYLGGQFQGTAKLDYSSLAIKYNGSKWERVGSEFSNHNDTLYDNRVNCMKVYKGQLFIGGRINSTNSPHQSNLIIWDGKTREKNNHLLFNDEVFDMEVVYHELYISGKFTTVSSKTTGCLAKWDGGNSHTVYNPPLRFQLIGELANYNNALFAEVSSIDSFNPSGLYKFDTTSWSIIDSELVYITDMLKYGNQLWICGHIQKDKYNNWIWDGNDLNIDTKNAFNSFKLSNLKSELYSLHYEKTYNNIPYNHISKYKSNISQVTGTVYHDKNNNCQKDPGEEGINDVYLKYNDSNVFKPVNHGFYQLNLAKGSHTLSFGSGLNDYRYYTVAKCASVPYSLNLNKIDEYNGYDFPLVPKANIPDLKIEYSAYRGFKARQGFRENYKIKVQNVGTTDLSNIKIKLFHDSIMRYVNSNKMPDYNQNYELHWNISSLKPGQKYVIRPQFETSLFTSLDDSTSFFVEVNPTHNDSNFYDNYDTLVQFISAAIDPNDKQSYPSGNITKKTNIIDYVINFQNIGNDTAFKVVVIDTIDATKLKLHKIYINDISHPYQFEIIDNVFIWTFDNILLPDSTTNEKESHGFISYTAHINPNLNIGDSILNKADIFFDYQKPVTTNYAKLLIISIPDTQINDDQLFKVFPNPSRQNLIIESKQYQITTVRLYDLNGKQMYLADKIDSKLHTINTLNLGSGLYILQVYNGENKQQFKIQVIH